MSRNVFEIVETFLQWFNVAGYLCVKKPSLRRIALAPQPVDRGSALSLACLRAVSGRLGLPSGFHGPCATSRRGTGRRVERARMAA